MKQSENGTIQNGNGGKKQDGEKRRPNVFPKCLEGDTPRLEKPTITETIKVRAMKPVGNDGMKPGATQQNGMQTGGMQMSGVQMGGMQMGGNDGKKMTGRKKMQRRKKKTEGGGAKTRKKVVASAPVVCVKRKNAIGRKNKQSKRRHPDQPPKNRPQKARWNRKHWGGGPEITIKKWPKTKEEKKAIGIPA